MRCVIIGGVAGGATAAARMRRIDEFAEIVLFEKSPYISYANCGLPYYVGGTIADRAALFLQTPESFSARFNVDVRVGSEVIAIDSVAKIVTVQPLGGDQYTMSYDKLLLSPGAIATPPPFPVVDSDAIFSMRNVDDTDKIFKYVTSRDVEHAVVIGAGFIGLEMAENLYDLGIDIAIVERDNQVMPAVDFNTASFLHQHLKEKGVELHLSKSVTKIDKEGEKLCITFDNGETIATDLILLSLGVIPETTLAKSAGIKIGTTRGIWVDEYLETSVKDIYAVGDVIEYPHPITGEPWMNLLANPANRQGRIVADNMIFGNKIKYEGAIGTAVAKVFDRVVAATGLSSKKLKKLGIAHQTSITHSFAHASYYPGAEQISTELAFDIETGKLYGAQAVGGKEGVDKRIDQIALVIKNGGTIYDLTQVEHCYAPPFSAAKDPVAIAGYVASNLMSGALENVQWKDVVSRDKENVILLDVRNDDEVKEGAIPGHVHIPLDSLRARLDELPKDKMIYTYCAIGLRGYLAYKILKARGFKNVKNIAGGFKTYAFATK